MRLRLLIATFTCLFLAGNANCETASLKLLKSETITTGVGVKSVLMHPSGKTVYSINLEDMSVHEFDRLNRRTVRILKFVATPGTGFDYTNKKWVSSFEEKPVESHLTHDGRFLWISLHNASGVAVWDLQGSGDTCVAGRPYKEAHVHGTTQSDSEESPDMQSQGPKGRKIRLLFIKTGKTPKVITSSSDGRYLFVANWHSDSVSVLQIDSPEPKDWSVVRTLASGRIPRGLSVSRDSKYLYVADMGGSVMTVYDLSTFSKAREINVGRNPRHIVDDGSHMYVSLNQTAKLVSVSVAKGVIDASADTCKSPRTIALGANRSIAFVVCYHSDRLQAFAVPDLNLMNSWESPGHPVGVDTWEDGPALEVWVANYMAGTIKVFSFDTSGPAPSTP
jgi:6-phosphogluconolactonase (cycloisomerase 2 family)